MTIEETIHQAGTLRRLMKITYLDEKGQTTYRTVECYKVKANPEGRAMLCAWDIEKNDHIRNFFLDKISEAIITNLEYGPRNGWEIEIQ